MRARAVLSLMTCAVVSSAASAHAQDNSAAVEALFSEGKRLEAEGKIAEACQRFFASYSLEQRLGTLLNLADCYEKNGQLASAWARFVEARTLALRASQQERADFANEHATALEPKLSKLTIVVARPAPGLVVKRDGVVVEPGALGVAVPVDAGTHSIEVSAPGKKAWTTSVVVGTEGDQKNLEVPALVDAPRLKPPAERATPIRRPEPQRGEIGARGITGLAIAGAGVVAVGVGSAFGLVALGKNSDSNAYCGLDGNGKNDCYSEGYALRQEAQDAGNVSTALLATGAAFVVGGLVLWLTAPKRPSKVDALLRIGSGVF